MVFESLVTDLINRYLGNYVERLNASQLKIGLLGGNAQLENLDIKTNAFDDFDLPVKVCQGHIGKLTLKIPFQNLYTQPVIVDLEDVYVLVVPNIAVSYNEEKERKYQNELKQKELLQITEAKAREEAAKNKSGNESGKDDTFGEKLAAQIVKNVQVNVRNIHIRYEDRFTIPDKPFTAGFSLYNLSFKTTDASGNPITIKDEAVREFFKSVQLNCLTLYWNTGKNTKFFSDLPRSMLTSTMKASVYSPEKDRVDHDFIIKPISAKALMHIHMRPEITGFTVPQMTLDLNFQEIKLVFTREQYHTVIAYVDALDRLWTQSKYRKFRPTQPLKENYKAWWLYPYNVILNETVRRRRAMWSWQHIKRHREKCRDYVRLWEMKILDGKLKADDMRVLEILEEELDVLNITLSRQKAEMSAKKKEKRGDEAKKAGGGGWFSGWWGGKKPDETKAPTSVTEEISAKLRMEMTPEEKEKLYTAIGYSEKGLPQNIPKEYISLKCNAILHRFSLKLLDRDLEDPTVIDVNINTLSSQVEQRAAANAIKVCAFIDSMELKGVKKADNSIPSLVTSQLTTSATTTTTNRQKLVNVLFETNPLDVEADSVVKVDAEPLQIIYDADTINEIVRFVTPPEDLRFKELSATVLASLDDVKSMTATSLKYVANKRIYTDINVDIKPSYFILPERGYYQEGCRLLLIDLGMLKIQSEKTVDLSEEMFSRNKRKKLNYEAIKEQVYDKFKINLSSIQMLMIEKGQDWRQLRKESSCPNHILKPFGVYLDVKKCVITNDPKLTKLTVEGCLPLLAVDISDQMLKSLLELVLHVPFPEGPPPDPELEALKEWEEDFDDETDVRGYTTNRIMRTVMAVGGDSESDDTMSISTTTTEGASSDISDTDQDAFQDAMESLPPKNRRRREKNNFTDIEAMFIIRKVIISVQQCQSSSSSSPSSESMERVHNELLNFQMNEIGSTFVKRTFDQELQAYLGSISVTIPCFIDKSTGSPLSIIRTKDYQEKQNLLFIRLLIADKKGPQFKTLFNNTRHQLTAEFKVLRICIHQESLLKIMDFLNELLPALQVPPTDPLLAEKWAEKTGDIEELKRLKNKKEENEKKRQDDYISPKEKVNEMQAKKRAKVEQRLADYEEKATKGQPYHIPELQIVQWKVHASIDKVKFVLCSEQELLAEASMRQLDANLALTYRTTEVSVTLTNLKVTDGDQHSHYSQIFWIDSVDHVLKTSLVLYNEHNRQPDYASDLNKIDMQIELEIGKANVIFLSKFVNRFIRFSEKFQAGIEKALAHAEELSKNAIQQVQKEIESPSSDRFRFNIQLNAPAVYIPAGSQSSQVLLLDLGSLHISNQLQYYAESKAIAELNTIQLQNVTLSRGLLQREEVYIQSTIIKPIDVNVVITRNLSQKWFKEEPLVFVDSSIPSIEIALCQGDYSKSLSIICLNIKEGQQPGVSYSPPPTAPVPTDLAGSSAVDSGGASKQDPTKASFVNSAKTDKTVDLISDPHYCEFAMFKFKFRMGNILLNLYNGDEPVTLNDRDLQMRALACFLIDSMTANGKILLNNEMSFGFRLGSCSLTDSRPEAKERITRILDTKDDDKLFLLDVEFFQDKNNHQQVNLEVCSIYTCVCLEYLFLLLNFFIKGLPPEFKEPSAVAVDKVDNNQPKSGPLVPNSTTSENKREKTFALIAKVQRPEIILVEDMSDQDTNAIILTTEMDFRYSQMEDCDIISGIIKDFQIFSCPFQENLRERYRKQILSPASLSLYAKKPLDDSLQGELSMEELLVTVTPKIIETTSKIFSKLAEYQYIENKEVVSVGIPNVEEGFWNVKPLCLENIPVLYDKINKKESNGLVQGIDMAQALDDKEKRDERINVRFDVIRFVMESQLRNKSVPMFVVETSCQGHLLNPSSKLAMEFDLEVAVSYFNDQINQWEPLLETYPEQNNRRWSLHFELNSYQDENNADEDSEWEEIHGKSKLRQNILIESHDNLELTLSKTALDVLQKLGKSFENAYNQQLVEPTKLKDSPYTIDNLTGEEVRVRLDEHFETSNGEFIDIPPGQSLSLKDKEDAACKSLTMKMEEKRHIWFSICGGQEQDVIIDRSEKHLYSVYKPGLSSPCDVIVEIQAYLGQHTLVFRSAVMVNNKSGHSLDVFTIPETKATPELLFTIASNESKPLTLNSVYVSRPGFFIKSTETETPLELSREMIIWKGNNNKNEQLITCASENGTSYNFIAFVELQETVDSSNTCVLSAYEINILNPISFHNQLPAAVCIHLKELIGHDDVIVQPGYNVPINKLWNSLQKIPISMEFMENQWKSELIINKSSNQIEPLTFVCESDPTKPALDLSVHYKMHMGQQIYTLHASYWILNKTGKLLTFKTNNNHEFQHPATLTDPYLFTFKAKGGNKLFMRMDNSEWSCKLPLETVGSAGLLTCKNKNGRNFEIRVTIELSSSCLSKIVTFMPYYMILNRTQMNIEFIETIPTAQWFEIGKGEVVPFWPCQQDSRAMCMRARVAAAADDDENKKDSNQLFPTAQFQLFESHNAFLKLDNQFGGLFVEVQTTDDLTLISFSQYDPSMILAKFVNMLKDKSIFYNQAYCKQVNELKPGQEILYAWEDPLKPRELIWRVGCENDKVVYKNTLTMDGIDEFCIHDKRGGFWVSFLNNTQRTLLFTQNGELAKYARTHQEAEPIEREIQISFTSIGLSLVDNKSAKEICYISMTSSGVVWNRIGKKKRLKPLSIEQSVAIENAHQDYVQKLRFGPTTSPKVRLFCGTNSVIEVDLAKKTMLFPDPCELQRNFEPAIFVTASFTKSLYNFYFKLFHLQVDSQISDATFPVVFSPTPPPKSVDGDQGQRYLVEMSLVVGMTSTPGVFHIKYGQVLIQEMQVKLDQAFISSMVNLFSATVVSPPEEEAFKADLKLIENNLSDAPIIHSTIQGGKRSIFETLHISPIKVHLSFTMVGAEHAGGLYAEFLSLLLRSVGVVLTEVQDVVFKLAYFEKQNTVMSFAQLQTMVQQHYINQALKQMYVLVFGLDVLGNPFGVLRGVAQGVEDLFYEPVKGAVLGPEEFAQGVAIGVRSLFGHTVGGAAGAVSKITGTIGKGVAALTLDEDFIKLRRERMAKQPKNIGGRLAQGGQGIVMGVFHGVTGVVTQPISGAKKDGVEGFFKGVGKGLIGVVTRPVAGVVDFASSGFEGIRQVTDVTKDVGRIRLPRFIASGNSVIQPYNRFEAEGSFVFNLLNSGKVMKTDAYEFHAFTPTRKHVLFLTDKNIIYAERNDLMSSWSTDWILPLTSVVPPVIVASMRLTLVTKDKQKSLFGTSSNNVTKSVELNDAFVKLMAERINKKLNS